MFTGVREEDIINKGNRRRCAFNVEQNNLNWINHGRGIYGNRYDRAKGRLAPHDNASRWKLLHICGNVSWPHAERLITCVLAAFGVMRRPARRVLKQTDGANPL